MLAYKRLNYLGSEGKIGEVETKQEQLEKYKKIKEDLIKTTDVGQ